MKQTTQESHSPHIIFVDQFGTLGGGQQVLFELISAAQKKHCTIQVMLPKGDFSKKLSEFSCAITNIPEYRFNQGKKTVFDIIKWFLWSLLLFWNVRSHIKKADLLYINGLRLLLLGALSSIFLRKKVAYHVHLHHTSLERKLIRSLLRLHLTVAIIVPSAFIYQEMKNSDSRILLIPNGLDARFSQVQYTNRFMGEPLKRIAIIGRVSPEKGQNILEQLVVKFPTLEFHIFGDAAFSDQDYYIKLKNKLESKVYFHGWVNDIITAVNSSNIQLLLVPSRCQESFSLTTIQGAALSCLVVVRKLGALIDLSDELDLLCFTTDASLHTILTRLIEEKPKKLAQQTSVIYSKTLQRYSFEMFQKRLSTLIDHLLQV